MSLRTGKPQRLIDAARRGDDPPAGAKQRIQRELSKRLALGAASGLAVTSAGVPAMGAVLKVAGVVFAVGGTVLGASALLEPLHTPPERPVAAKAARAAPQPASARPALPSVSAPAAEQPRDAGPDPAALAGRRTPSRTREPQPPERVAPALDPLRAEAAGVRAANEAIQRGDPQGALRLIAEQERSFPGGMLAEERAAVRVLALCKLEQGAPARTAARRFLERFPQSPLVPRVRAGCARFL